VVWADTATNTQAAQSPARCVQLMKTLITICFFLLISGCIDSPTNQENSNDLKYFETKLSEEESPNRKRKLQLGELGNDSTIWTTQVLVAFDGCGGGVYAVDGRNLSIKTYWKGNDTIIIETMKTYKAHQRHEWMQCFTEKIKIIYIEK